MWEARALSFVVDGVPDNVSVQGVPPSAVFRIRVGHHCHQSAARPPSSNPQWGDETNSARCRRAFRIATPADILAESEEDDDLGRLARHFAGPTGVKVRDRSYLPAMTTHEQSFTGKKAIDWLTGVHSRGYHGSGLVATRDEARVLAQEMMNRGIFHDSTRVSRLAPPAFRLALPHVALAYNENSPFCVSCVPYVLTNFSPHWPEADVDVLVLPGVQNVSAQRRKVPPPMPPAPSPDGWVERVMADGDVYYVNRDTGEKSWTPPGPEAAKAPPRPVFRDSSSAFYRFDAEWLAAKSRQSKIMLRRKTLERRESMRQTRSGTTLDVDVAVCDEVVIELLDAELAARLGPTDDVLPEQLLGSVAIPLHTICQHEGSEGWHNLQGPGVVTGELRVGWLMLEDDTSPSEIAERLQRPAGFVDSQCPSPKHQLKVQSAAEAATATAAATTTRRERALLGNVSPGLQLHDSTGTGKGDDLAGEDGTPVSSGAQAAACCRMAQSYIDVGELGPAQACLSAGLGLVRTADRAVLLEMQEYLARCAAIANTQGGQIGSWTPLFRRQASGDYRVSHHTQYDRQAPWVEWRGTRHDESGGFCDVLGFVVPPVSARSWRLAHSHSLCVSARHRPRWATLIPPSAFGSNGSGRLPTPDASRPTPPRWTGWGPGSQDADAVAELVMQHGVPPELRRLVWPALLGATALQEQALRGGQGDLYLSLVARYTKAGEHRKQIRKDIHRTLPGQCTVVNSPEGAECLERVLGAFSEYDRWYGYTQSLNMVAAHLLVVLSLEAEEDVFWMLAQIVEVVVPEYYSSELFGMNADAVVLNMLAEHWVYTTQARIAEVGVPITLVASRWLLPLCAEILPPSTLYRLWDLLFLTRSAVPLHAAALTIMRGAHADSFWDFEGAMRVLTHGASAAYDSQPFIEHVTGYMALFPESDLAAQHYSCLVNGYVDDDGIPMVVSPLDGLAARLPGFEEALQTAWLGPGYGWDAPARIELDRWQIFRLATPFAEELEHEAAAAEEAASSAEDEHGALTISVDGAIEALGGLLPGLRQRPELLERFVRRVLVMPPNGPHHHSAAASTGAAEERVTLACWLNTLMALQPQASESLARWSVWWRFCGGGRVGGGRIRDGAKGATMDEVTEAICAVYSAIAGPGGDDGRSLPTEAAVRGSVNAFYTQRDKSWVKRSAKKHGLGRRSTARMVALHHRLVYEALDWDSPLCLGVRIPPRKPPPPTRSSRATFL